MADSKVYFLKEILSNPINIKGTNVAFENIGGNRGVVALDPANGQESQFITELNQFASQGVGGVSRITEAQYIEKKNQPAPTPSGRQKEMLRLRPTGPRPRPVQPPAEATVQAVAPPAEPAAGPLDTPLEPIGTPAPGSFQPPTRRISRKTESVL